jgi:hypothetical protein
MRLDSKLANGARTVPTFDRYSRPEAFQTMTRAEGKELLDRIYREVQKVRSNLVEARTNGIDDWEKRFGSYDDDETLRNLAPRLFGPRSIMAQLTDIYLDPAFTPLDLYNVLVMIFDDQTLKTHLMMFSGLKRQLPSLSGWADEAL